jgi:hypothetical protein
MGVSTGFVYSSLFLFNLNSNLCFILSSEIKPLEAEKDWKVGLCKLSLSEPGFELQSSKTAS